MPTLDELPSLPLVSNLSSDDLFPVLDVTGGGSSRIRKVTLQALTQDIGANNAGFGSISNLSITAATAFSHTINKAMVFVGGAFTGANGVATLTLPSVSTSSNKAVTISAAFTSASGGAATLVVVSPSSNSLFTPASSSGVTSVTLPAGFVYRFRTDNINWYRIS